GSRGDGAGFGVFNAAGAGQTTWCGFARAVFERSRERGGPHAGVAPITTADYPTPAARPANSVLDCSKLRATWNVALPPWEQGLDACMDELTATPT
ncbi:MAG: sugar nucleotide-binding protein, partial [Pseudomonadota bacterium]